MNLCRLPAAIVLCTLATPAFTQVSVPRTGLVRYADGGVYPVSGVQGNYIVGSRLFDAVDALSSSEAGGLLFRRGNLLLLDGNAVQVATFGATGTAKAVVGIQQTVDSAIAWLPSLQILVHWSGGAFNPMTLPGGTVNGQVLNVAKTSVDTAVLLVRQDSGTLEEDRISLLNGSVISRSTVPGAAGDVYQAGSATVAVQNGQMTLTSAATGNTKAVPIRAQNVQFERMSSTCVHLHAADSGRDWLLHISGDQPLLFELPAPAAVSAPVAVSQ